MLTLHSLRSNSIWQLPCGMPYGVVLIVICLFLMAPKAASQASEDEILVQLKWLHQFQFAGYYAAKEKGFYQDKGLNVRLLERTTGMDPADDLISGHVTYAVTDSGVMIYRSHGLPLVALAAIFQHSPSILLARKDKGIASIKDLVNKRVRLTAGYMNAEVVSMIESVGVDIYDLNLVSSNLTAEGLINGELDAINAYTTNEPLTLQQKGVPFVAFHPRDYGVNFYGDILVTTEEQIQNDPEGVRQFREATLQGWDYAINNPAEMVDIILEKYNTQNKSREALEFEAQELIKLVLAEVVPIGYMNKTRWAHIAEVFKQQGKVSGDIDLDSFLYSETPKRTFFEATLYYKMEVGVLVFLVLSVVMAFHIVRLRSEVNVRTQALRKEKEKAELEARTDVLTNLPNRRHFMKVLDRDVGHADRYDSGLAVMVIDIDFFKRINDIYSHSAGDEALKKIGLALADSVRAGDVVARLGGEEFVITCPNTDTAEAAMLAERLREKIERLEIRFREQLIHVTISVGLAKFEQNQTSDQLLHCADLALYKAKETGRNCVKIYKADPPPTPPGEAVKLKSVR